MNTLLQSNASAAPKASLKIGDVQLGGRVLAAPMTGVTDLPFRRTLSRLGAAVFVVKGPELKSENELVMPELLSRYSCCHCALKSGWIRKSPT